MANTKYKFVGGIDVGNGYTKSRIFTDEKNHVIVDMPSCVSYISNSGRIPIEPDNTYMSEIWNELDADIVSDAIKDIDKGRIIFGKRSVNSGETSIVFNLDDATPKCDDSLSAEIVLGVIAAVAVKKYWDDNGALPEDKLFVNMSMGIALPISDYMAHRKSYEKKFMDSVHTVHIHNFARDITVDITFDEAVVLPEGAAAQYAITDLGAEFLENVLKECRAGGVKIDESITGNDLVSYENVVGIDIGSGNVNFVAFTNGRVNVDLSSAINKGYESVPSSVVRNLRSTPFAPQSRKELAEFMIKTNLNPQQKKLQQRLQQFIDDEVAVFARDIIMEFKSVLSKTRLNLDAVYVYGGGADAVKDTLYPMLMEAAKLDEDVYIPVIYLSSAYSRSLNRNGLCMVAQMTDKAKKN